MILFDVGNTHTTVAITEDKKNFIKSRFSTKKYETEDELFTFLKSVFGKDFYSPIVVSSVVPSVNVVFEYFSKKYGDGNIVFVNAEDYKAIKWNVAYPKEIGADRVCDVVAAKKDYGENCIVIDYGTAITIEVLKDGIYEGGAILTGFAMAIEALFRGTAKLPLVELKPYEGYVGKDTESNIRIGVINGLVGAVNQIVNEIKKEFSVEPVVIHTGGQSTYVSQIISGTIDKDLTLRGMLYFYEDITR